MDSGEQGMNPATMTIINPWKEYWLSREWNQRPPFLMSCALLTELWGSAVESNYSHIQGSSNDWNFHKKVRIDSEKERKCWLPSFFTT